jgi:ribonuclease T2
MKLWKLLGLLGLMTLSLWGRQEAVAVSVCPAWNDLRESRNVDNRHLRPGERYRVDRHYKGHYLVLWSDGRSRRWVRDECLRSAGKKGDEEAVRTGSESTGRALHSLLVLSWHNAFCETHAHRKECRPVNNLGAGHLVLHGLWPQPRERVYCGVPERLKALDRQKRWRALPPLKLTEALNRRMLRFMPGVLSGLERHEWIKHGSCYDPDPVRYFDDALSLTEQVDRSAVGEYLRANEGRRVTLAQLRRLFERSFGRGTGRKLAMECRRGLLTELKVSLRGKGKDLQRLLRNAPTLKSRCREGIVDAPGLYRRR